MVIEFRVPFVIHGLQYSLALRFDAGTKGACLLINLCNLLYNMEKYLLGLLQPDTPIQRSNSESSSIKLASENFE